MSSIERRPDENNEEDEGFPFVEFAMGIAFIFGAVVFGLIEPPYTLVVSFGLMIPASALIGSGIKQLSRNKRLSSRPDDREGELLGAMRENSGSITPTEAALRTTLTVTEADRMLSELASGGHLLVESEGGTLFYTLPRSHGREIG